MKNESQRNKLNKAQVTMGAASEIVKRGADNLGNAQAQNLSNITHHAFADRGYGKAGASIAGVAMTGIAHAAPAVAAAATVAAPLVLVGAIGWGLYKLFDD